MLEWNDSLSVHVDEIDAQHKQLVGIVNNVYSLMTTGADGDAQVLGIISDMRAYAVEHFATEEKYMDRYEYPDAPAHKTEHVNFVEKVNEVEEGCRNGSCPMSMEILNFLSDWLVTHISDTDSRMGEFLSKSI